jgi:hypothetical protein
VFVNMHVPAAALYASVRAHATVDSDQPGKRIDAALRRSMFTPLVQGKESRIVEGAPEH